MSHEMLPFKEIQNRMKLGLNTSRVRKSDNDYVVCVDCDQTVLNKGYVDNTAKQYFQKFRDLGCVMVLWTCRTGDNLENAISTLENAGISFDYCNEYPPRPSSAKVYADLYIDDKATPDGKIDWEGMYQRAVREKGLR